MDKIIVAGMGPLVSAMMAGLGFWLRHRLQRRNSLLAYREARQQATEQVAFIESWLRTHAQLAGSEDHERARQRALVDLDKAYAFVDQPPKPARRHTSVSLNTALTGILLLDHRGRTFGAKVAAALYYLSLAWLLIWLAAAVMFGGAVAFVDSSDLSFIGASAMSLGIFLLCLAVGVGPALPLYCVARSVAGVSPLPLSDSDRNDAMLRRG